MYLLRFLKKDYFSEKLGQENNQEGTQPLKFFVQKIWCNVAPEFKTKHAIINKVKNLTKHD